MSKKDSRLIIYEKYTNLIYYSKNLTMKYPKSERFDLCSDIKELLYKSLRNIIYAWKEFDVKKRLQYLKEADVDLLVLRNMVKISHMYHYITDQNYMVWNEKIAEIGRLLGGWIKSCPKE